MTYHVKPIFSCNTNPNNSWIPKWLQFNSNYLSLHSLNALCGHWAYFSTHTIALLFIYTLLWFDSGSQTTWKSVSVPAEQQLHISKVLFTHGSWETVVVHLPHARLKFAGVLAMLYDHKPWPDHPRDPAGYCQICNGIAVIAGSLTACIQSRNRLSFAGRRIDRVTCKAPLLPSIRGPENSCSSHGADDVDSGSQ